MATRDLREAPYGSGIRIEALAEDARRLESEEFEACHGPGFLLLTTSDLRRPEGPATTEVRLEDSREATGERTVGVSLVVYALVKTERSVGHMVTVGRTANNDVAIPDLGISRFHAFFAQPGGGPMRLQDARSTNGTTCNGVAVPAQGEGPAVELKTGDSISFGHLQLTYLDAAALQDFARQFER